MFVDLMLLCLRVVDLSSDLWSDDDGCVVFCSTVRHSADLW